MGQGLYVYALIKAGQRVEPGGVGLEHEGRPAPVHVVPVGPIAAVVSDYDAKRRVLPLRRNLEPHHVVVHALIGATTVVPMTFGQVARDRQELVRVLQPRATAILAELERLDGKVEMGLKLRWSVANVVKHLVDADHGLAALRDRLFAPGRSVSAAEKLELGRLFEERLRAERAELTQRVLTALQPLAVDSRVGEPLAEETIADLALLIRRETRPDLERRVQALADQWPPVYVFQFTGPWAPFNFVELELAGFGAGAGSWAC